MSWGWEKSAKFFKEDRRTQTSSLFGQDQDKYVHEERYQIMVVNVCVTSSQGAQCCRSGIMVKILELSDADWKEGKNKQNIFNDLATTVACN